MGEIDRKVLVWNFAVEGYKVILIELLIVDKKGRAKIKLVFVENKL